MVQTVRVGNHEYKIHGAQVAAVERQLDAVVFEQHDATMRMNQLRSRDAFLAALPTWALRDLHAACHDLGELIGAIIADRTDR